MDILERIANTHPALFCVNDDEDSNRAQADKIIRSFLSDYFPKPSSFETDYVDPDKPVVSRDLWRPGSRSRWSLFS